MVALLGNVLVTVVLIALSWFVLVGGTGAFIASSLGSSVVVGFVVAVIIPVPLLGWFAVWVISSRDAGSSSRSEDLDHFADSNVGYGNVR